MPERCGDVRRACVERLAELSESQRDEIDGVSRASLERPSAHERNPQVRLSCELRVEQWDRARVAGSARLLAVFDDERSPLRSISFQRRLQDVAEARREVRLAWDRYREAFGSPHEVWEQPDADEQTPLAPYTPLGAGWRWGDFGIRFRALRLSATAISYDETAEIPWPVRPDARLRPSSATR
ncbi:MAG: hypothetical protein NZ898_06595 [Myxococcota bacterium]|nr:hypothetical protein [Myxococcota bacterium]MDW8362429.1 hypothetical protein [Myxococcales bacterium]